jgi:hypothetical protein
VAPAGSVAAGVRGVGSCGPPARGGGKVGLLILSLYTCAIEAELPTLSLQIWTYQEPHSAYTPPVLRLRPRVLCMRRGRFCMR